MGAPASGVFGCNVEAVETTAQQLSGVLDELKNFKSRDDEYAAALASNPIHSALDHFSDDSSDQRDKITGSVEALRDMLQGLAQGVHDVDQALAGSLPDAEPVPASSGGAR
jgi:hypothetical protein